MTTTKNLPHNWAQTVPPDLFKHRSYIRRWYSNCKKKRCDYRYYGPSNEIRTLMVNPECHNVGHIFWLQLNNCNLPKIRRKGDPPELLIIIQRGPAIQQFWTDLANTGLGGGVKPTRVYTCDERFAAIVGLDPYCSGTFSEESWRRPRRESVLLMMIGGKEEKLYSSSDLQGLSLSESRWKKMERGFLSPEEGVLTPPTNQLKEWVAMGVWICLWRRRGRV